MQCARLRWSSASMGWAALVLFAAMPAWAQRYPTEPRAQAQPRRAVGGASNPAGHEARAGRDELAPVGEMRRKLRPPELLAEALSTPQDAFREGEGWALGRSLARASDRSQQVRIAQLYWKLSGAQAEYFFARQRSHLLWKATEKHAASPAVQSARYNAEGAVNDCEVSVVDAQHELAEAMRLGPNDALPLAIDRPHVGDYKTHFDALFAGGRTPPARLRLTNRAIPIRRKAIDVHGEAILAAQDALDATVEEFERGSTDLTTLLAGFSELDRQRRAFVRSVRDYNQDIAEYALSVAPQGSREDALVAMLIRTPTPRSAPPGERRGDARIRGENEIAPRGRTFGQYDDRGDTAGPPRAAGEESRSNPRDGYGAAPARDPYGAAPQDGYGAPPRDGYGAAPPREAYGTASRDNGAAPREAYPAAPRDDYRSSPRNGDRFATPDYAAPPEDAAAPRDDTRFAPRDDNRYVPRDGAPTPAGREDNRAPAAGSYDPAGQGGRTAPPSPRYAPPSDYRSSQRDRSLAPGDPRVDSDVVPAAADDAPARFGAVEDADAPYASPPNGGPFAPRRYQSQKPALEPESLDGSAPRNDLTRVTARRPFEESAPAGGADPGEFAALEHLPPALRAQRLAGLLHWWQRILPPDAGQPTSLPVALEQAPASRRKQVIDAYWRAREAAAHYQALAEAGEQLAPLASWATRETDSRHAASAMLRLRAARLGLRAELLDAHVGMIVAEYILATAMGTSLDAAWPLPTTIPHAGRYRVRESHLTRRAAPYSADHLPPLESSMQELAAAVVFADAARTEATRPAHVGPQAIGEAISRVYTQLGETQSFLRTQTEYNVAIADYALRTLPAGAPVEQVVSRLVIARNLRDGA